MRSVRCDVCGTKALVAASKCPKCGHAFEVRDGFGELLPLAHCNSCDSYYPEHLGSCRWCGTKPERSPIGPLGPYLWKGVGILTFASLAIGAWLAKNSNPSPTDKPAPRTFVADTLPTNQPKAESFGRKIALAQPGTAARVAATDSAPVAVFADSARDTTASVAFTDSSQAPSTPVVATETVAIQSAGTVAQPDSAPVERASEKNPRPVPARAPERAAPRKTTRSAPRATVTSPPRATVGSRARAIAKAPPRTAAKPPVRSSAGRGSIKGNRWVTSVARNWAVVRSNPTRQSRIVAAIGPNTRVQLGETRGEWRRIRAKGLAGWVEHRRLVARAVPATRAGRLAAR